MSAVHCRIIAVAATLLVTAGAGLASPASAADTWQIDAVHSTVMFKIFHANAGYFFGNFNEFSGEIISDAASPPASSVYVEIQAASVSSRNAKRDEHLKGPDFFNVVQFPTITFRSTSVEAVDDDTVEVTGDMTMHGVTKSITTTVDKTGEALSAEAGKSRVGFLTEFTIKRSDFGMTYGVDKGGLGDEVTVTLSFEATR